METRAALRDPLEIDHRPGDRADHLRPEAPARARPLAGQGHARVQGLRDRQGRRRRRSVEELAAAKADDRRAEEPEPRPAEARADSVLPSRGGTADGPHQAGRPRGPPRRSSTTSTSSARGCSSRCSPSASRSACAVWQNERVLEIVNDPLPRAHRQPITFGLTEAFTTTLTISAYAAILSRCR